MPSALNIAEFYNNTNSVNIPTGGIAGMSASKMAQTNNEISKFQALIDGIQAGMENKSSLSSEQITESGRLNGDYTTGMKDAFTNPADKIAMPSGAAANAVGAHGMASSEKIDKSSKLYEQALELESYFVKIMLGSMRNTISKTNLFGDKNSYAQDMYEDMLYDEYASAMTKAAGFGLADQVYLQLAGK